MIECQTPTSMNVIPKRTKKRPEKPDLLAQLVQLTGFSGQIIRRELHDILENKGINIHDITLEQLRSVAATYLRQIMKSLCESHSTKDQAH